MIVLGIDPGAKGAFAMVERKGDDVRLIGLHDMPRIKIKVGKTERVRVDPVGLMDLCELYKVMGVGLAVVEAVGGRTSQSASAAYHFGYAVGLVNMALIAMRIPLEQVPSASWKRELRIPGKKSGDEFAQTIIERADQMFPDDAGKWRSYYNRKGETLTAFKLDRAEAALIGAYGARRVAGSIAIEMDINSVKWREKFALGPETKD